MYLFGLLKLFKIIRSAFSQDNSSDHNAYWLRAFGLNWNKSFKAKSFRNLDYGPNTGIPLGGIGSGSISRAPDGNFNLWNLSSGTEFSGIFPDCQFSLFENNGSSKKAHALSVRPKMKNSQTNFFDHLSSWNWYPSSSENTDTGTYKAQYPLS